jgi:hypothetical protein
VERRFARLRTLEPVPPRTILFAGLSSRALESVTREQFDVLDAAIKSGSRIVFAFRAQAAGREDDSDDNGTRNRGLDPAAKPPPRKTPPSKDAPSGRKAPEKSPDRKAPDEKRESGDEWAIRPNYVDVEKRWGVEVKERFLVEREGNVARRDPAVAGGALPERVTWHSDVYLRPDPVQGWHTLYRRATEPVVIERTLERGSIVIATDAYFLSNEALERDRAAGLLAWVVGPNRVIVFDEAHLGVVADPGVATLARRYGLSGAFFTLLVLALLFVWRRTARFVPPPPEATGVALRYHPAAGLEALLRRAVPADKVVAACAAEWAPTAREADRRRLDAALAGAGKASVVDRYNAIVRALRRRGVATNVPREPAKSETGARKPQS